MTEAPELAAAPLRDGARRAAVLRELRFEDVFFFDGAFRAAVFFLLVDVRFLETDFFVVFFFEVRFFEVVVRFLLAAVRFLLTADRFLLAAGRFLRLAEVRAVLRTEALFFDVFFLAAALFAGIVALQERLNETGDYTGARRKRKA